MEVKALPSAFVLRKVPTQAALLLLSLLLSGCFDIEYTGRIYSRGWVRADLLFVLPGTLEKRWYPLLFGPGVSSFTAALVQNEVRFLADTPRKNSYRVRAEKVSRLSLPWLVLNYSEPQPGTFAYAHGISFPTQILVELRQDLEQRLGALPASDRNLQALAQNLVASGKVFIRWIFPGEVTETNGTRIDERTIQWELKGTELERSGFQMGYAFGKITLWQRIWDRILIFFLHLFTRP